MSTELDKAVASGAEVLVCVLPHLERIVSELSRIGLVDQGKFYELKFNFTLNEKQFILDSIILRPSASAHEYVMRPTK